MLPPLQTYAYRFVLHVIQRGARRSACFFCEEDRHAYLHWLARYAASSGCDVHAYVLMGNHVHLLLTASRKDGAACLVRSLGERYARYVRDTHGRGTALWDDHLEARPVCPRGYLLACMRYIELNPVRAGLASRPVDYRWSSFRCNALGQEDALVTPHPYYYALGRSPQLRQTAYLALFQDEPIERAKRHNRPRGDEHIRASRKGADGSATLPARKPRSL
jgi:putative transposase